MGRLNHENSVAIPGYGKPVMFTTDDTFTTTPSQSQLYSYIADDADACGTTKALVGLRLRRRGHHTVRRLRAGRASTPTITGGHFIEVPKRIATGRNPDGERADGGGRPGGPRRTLPAPVKRMGLWQRFNNVGIDGPQWVLKKWSQLHNVFEGPCGSRTSPMTSDPACPTWSTWSTRVAARLARRGRQVDEWTGLGDGARPERPEAG